MDGAHHLARRHAEFRQPVGRHITASGGGILADVARDIGKLERQPQIAGPVQRRRVVRRDAHHHRHHAADDPRDMIAIAQQIIFAARRESVGVQREPRDQIVHPRLRQSHFGRHHAQRIERRIAGRLARQRARREIADPVQPGMRIVHHADRRSEILPVGQIVAFAAPRIEQPRPLARPRIEQRRCRRERFGSAGDAVARLAHQRGARGTHSSALLIRKIVRCGT